MVRLFKCVKSARFNPVHGVKQFVVCSRSPMWNKTDWLFVMLASSSLNLVVLSEMLLARKSTSFNSLRHYFTTGRPCQGKARLSMWINLC